MFATLRAEATFSRYELVRKRSLCSQGRCLLFSKMNSRQENGSKLSFTARIITKYSLESFLSIWGEKLSKGFLKFCKLISNLILGQIIVSNLTNVHKLNSRINYARRHYIGYKKTNILTIFFPKQRACSQANENDAIRNRISDLDKCRISQPKT